MMPAREQITTDPNFTTAGVSVTSDNTILYRFDTNILVSDGVSPALTLGGPSGTYIITATYKILNQVFFTPPFYFEVM